MRSLTRLLFASILATFTWVGKTAPRLQLDLDRDYYVEGRQNNFYLKTTLHTGEPTTGATSPASNLVFLVDRSGSMEGEKLAQLKTALQTALGQLSSNDRISLVAYGSNVETLIPPTQIDKLGNTLAAIENLTTDGGSALFAGLEHAAAEIKKNASEHSINRILLVCDGPPNKGVLDPERFAELAESIAREGASIATFALGSDAPKDLLSRLSAPSNASFHELPEPSLLAEKLSAELQLLNELVGKNATLEIEFHHSIDIRESIGREAELTSRRAIFRFDTLLAHQEIATIVQGSISAGATVFSTSKIATVRLTYQPIESETASPTAIEATISTRFVHDPGRSFESIHPHVYQTVCEYEVADAVREAFEAFQDGKAKKALRDLKKLSRDIRSVANDIPELQVQASLNQLNKTIDEIEKTTSSQIEQRALIETIYPTPATRPAETAQ